MNCSESDAGPLDAARAIWKPSGSKPLPNLWSSASLRIDESIPAGDMDKGHIARPAASADPGPLYGKLAPVPAAISNIESMGIFDAADKAGSPGCR